MDKYETALAEADKQTGAGAGEVDPAVRHLETLAEALAEHQHCLLALIRAGNIGWAETRGHFDEITRLSGTQGDINILEEALDAEVTS